MNNINLLEIIRNVNPESIKTIYVYPRYTTIDDPYEKTKSESFLEATPIKDAIVTEIGFGGLKWKYFGQMTVGSKQIICDKKYLTLLKVAGKIEIDNETYGIYVDADKAFQIISRQDYLLVLLERKI